MNDFTGSQGTAVTETRTSARAPLPATPQRPARPTSTARHGTAGRQPACPGRSEPLGRPATRRVTVSDLAKAKARGEKWPMLTAYDALTAHVFDQAGIPVLLVGDSAAMVASVTTRRSRSPWTSSSR